MDERYPIYAKADITVNIAKGPHNRTVNRVERAVEIFLSEKSGQPIKKRQRRPHPSQRRRRAAASQRSEKSQKVKS